jgi:hypothetical protein
MTLSTVDNGHGIGHRIAYAVISAIIDTIPVRLHVLRPDISPTLRAQRLTWHRPTVNRPHFQLQPPTYPHQPTNNHRKTSILRQKAVFWSIRRRFWGKNATITGESVICPTMDYFQYLVETYSQ